MGFGTFAFCSSLQERRKKKDTRQIQESHITYGSLQLSPFRLHFLELSFAQPFHLFSWRPDDSWATGVVCEVLPETDVPFFLLFFHSVLFWDAKIGWQLCACGYAGTLWTLTAVRRTHPASGLGSVPQKLSTFYLHGWVILARANAQSVHFNGWRWRWNAPFQSFVRSLTWQNPSRASYRGEAKKCKKKLQNKKKRKWNNDMSHKYSPNLSTFGKERQDRM